MSKKDFKLSEDGKTLLKYVGKEENLIIPDGIEIIGHNAFRFYIKLTSIKIPNSVKSIGDEAFVGCRFLASIDIPNSVKSIGYNAFYGCSSLESIEIPNSVVYLGGEVFDGCYGLKSIKLSNEITELYSGLFYNCRDLEKITLSSTTNTILGQVFHNCTKLIKSGKFKAFIIEKDGLYCIDKKYEENKWHYVRGALELCENGIHYVDNLYEIFDYYFGEIDKDIAIYEIETRGDDIKDEDCSKHCCRSIRLKRRIYREELIKMLNGEI